ncbi:MAG TPA: hypothetical protein VKU41_05155 [Polyangiaceae bacterium]|nr:hypothetical protein [Polyangiaceae bacterium]
MRQTYVAVLALGLNVMGCSGSGTGTGAGATDASASTGSAGATSGSTGGPAGGSGGHSGSPSGADSSSGPIDDGGSSGSSPPPTTDGGLVTYGSAYTDGQYNLGPVDYAETQFHNACAPGTKYPASIQQSEGMLLAGLWNGIPNVAGYCDACIYVTTGKGKSAMLRVVTYGDTTTDSVDVSPQAYQILNSGEYPRSMTWQFAKCPDTGAIVYEFQTGSSQYWTSFWVRNARVPISNVEVKCQSHDYASVARGTDGTLTDSGGFGQGPFSIRLTGADGQQVIDTFSWPSVGIAGAMLTAQGNFQ